MLLISRWDYPFNMNRVGFGTSYLLSVSLSADLLNSSQRVVTFDQASLGLTREFLIVRKGGKEVDKYSEFMIKTAVLLGADEDTARYK